MKKDIIFISHIAEEKKIAVTLENFLYKNFNNIKVFVSSHKGLSFGNPWMETIKSSIEHSNLMIVICSPLSITRPWINFEAGAGWIKGIPVIPLCHSGLTLDNLPMPIKSFQGGLLNSKEDIVNVFKIISEHSSKVQLISNDHYFFKAIKLFETKIKNTALLKDTTCIRNLLFHQVDLLKYSIYASTLDRKKLDRINFKNDDLSEFKFMFNNICNLFNDSLLMNTIPKKVFEVYYETICRFVDNIKFILTIAYNRIEIAPSIQELFYLFLFSIIEVADWHKGILSIDSDPNNRKMIIKRCEEESHSPKKKKPGDMFNYLIDYYKSLLYFQDWVIKYERAISGILDTKGFEQKNNK